MILCVTKKQYQIDWMHENLVWKLLNVAKEIKPIDSKWDFKRKKNVDSKVQTYKPKLVTRCYRRVQGIYYKETLSLIAMLKSISILLTLAAYHDYKIQQMNVKTIFINRNLKKDIYMI